MLTHWISSEPELLAVFSRLLMEANFETKKTILNGRLVEVRRGQLVYGRDAFSKKSGVSVCKLRRYMKLLESDQVISQHKTSKYTVISITNYEQYQATDQQTNQQIASKQPADSQQITTPKEVKEVKNVKKEQILPPYIPLETWADFVDHRVKLKSKMTDKAIKMLLNKLETYHRSGENVDQMLQDAIINGWKSVYPKGGNNGTGNQRQNLSAVERVRAASRRAEAERGEGRTLEGEFNTEPL